MTSALTVSGKVMGKTQPIFANWELHLPERAEQNPLTLRELLTQIVMAEIVGFRDRQRQRRLLQVLSPAQIHLGVEQGKVESGGSRAGNFVCGGDRSQSPAADNLELLTDHLSAVGCIEVVMPRFLPI